MPKKSYRRRNRGGDDELPKKIEEIKQEIASKPPSEQPKPFEEAPKPPSEQPKPFEEVPKPPSEQPKPFEEPPKPFEEQAPKPFEEPPKPFEEPPPKEDSWFSPKSEPKVIEETSEEPTEEPPEKKSIFTFGFIIAIIFSILALLLLSLGIYILVRKPLYPSETTGTVTSAKCVNNNCVLVIEFTPEGATDKLTSNELQISGNYNKGDSVKINYNPDSPSTFGVNLISPKVFGWSFIGISLLLLIIIWTIYYFTRR